MPGLWSPGLHCVLAGATVRLATTEETARIQRDYAARAIAQRDAVEREEAAC
jgi:hypothetical protein